MGSGLYGLHLLRFKPYGFDGCSSNHVKAVWNISEPVSQGDWSIFFWIVFFLCLLIWDYYSSGISINDWSEHFLGVLSSLKTKL